MEQAVTVAWGVFTKFVIPWLPGYIGAVIGIFFLGKMLSFWKMIAAFLVGVASVHYGAPAIIEYGEVQTTGIMDAIKFACGLFGFELINKGFKFIESMDLYEIVRTKFLGPKP